MSNSQDLLTLTNGLKIAQPPTLCSEHLAKAFEKTLRVFKIFVYSIYMICLRINLERIVCLVHHHEELTGSSNLNQEVEDRPSSESVLRTPG